MRIIALTGIKGSGKTTVFEMIKVMYPNAIEITFAEKIKTVIAKHLKLDEKYFYDRELKEKDLEFPAILSVEVLEGIIKEYTEEFNYDLHIRPHINKVLYTPREAMQYIGTEVLKSLNLLIHCEHAMKKADPNQLNVVTDMRFMEEFEYLRLRKDIELIPFIVRNSTAEYVGSADQHSSESDILNIGKKCNTIDNNRSIEDLRKKVIDIFKFKHRTSLLLQKSGIAEKLLLEEEKQDVNKS